VTWSPGETIVLQEVLRGRVWAARPMTVVRDDGDLLLLWFPNGTAWKAPITPPQRPREESRGVRLATCASRRDWVFRDLAWDVDTLSFTRSGDWHAVWVSWPEDDRDWGWYVNLQRPFRRTPIGIETMDLMLDVQIAPDRSWNWKDEDELATFVEHGVFDDELAAHVRDEGLRVVERAQRNEPPFGEPWREEWRPDPAWERPRLIDGWDRVCR
jgi:predicted RNA-binding protein associated with RNAse of E/G family